MFLNRSPFMARVVNYSLLLFPHDMLKKQCSNSKTIIKIFCEKPQSIKPFFINLTRKWEACIEKNHFRQKTSIFEIKLVVVMSG